jgi:uncharacterized membrane protein YbhN (UPF0104 family)
MATIQVFVVSWRWHLMLSSVGIRLPLATTFKVNVLSLFANTLMINVIGGAFTRVYLLSKISVPSAPVLSTTAIEKILAIAVLAPMSLAGIAILRPQLAPHLPDQAIEAAIITLAFAISAVLIFPRYARRWTKTAIDYLNAMRGAARDFFADRRALAVAALLTALSQVILVLIGGALTTSVWSGALPVQVMLVLPAPMLLAGLPISIGGWGVREFSIMAALGMLGAPPDVGLLVSLLIYGSTLGGLVVAGTLMLPFPLYGRVVAAEDDSQRLEKT